jgi:hypothetical protein
VPSDPRPADPPGATNRTLYITIAQIRTMALPCHDKPVAEDDSIRTARDGTRRQAILFRADDHWPAPGGAAPLPLGPEPPVRPFSRLLELRDELPAVVVVALEYVPVMTTSPALRPLVICVYADVVMPVETRR